MPIPTSRTMENARISIDAGLCNGCGLCVQVCKDLSLVMVNEKASPSQDPVFGCFACGHCMAVCPKDAIHIEGRALMPGDLFDLPGAASIAGYAQLTNLMKSRRSIRDYRKKEVPPPVLEKVIDAAKTAPMGIPPSDVHLLVMEDPDKVRAFSRAFCECLEEMKWITSPWFLYLMRPFWSRQTY